MANPTLTLIAGGETTTFAAAGPWIAAHSSALEQLVDCCLAPAGQHTASSST